MSNTLDSWMTLSRDELDAIYSKASPGPPPTGDTRGTAIVTGSILPRTLARFANLFAWQGKVFDIFADNGNSGVLINKITPFSLNFIVAKVYRSNSWLDQQETIVIDYSKTSFVAKVIRDEIRQVEPGLYLGKVWWGKRRVLDFALTCPDQKQAGNPDSADVAGNKVQTGEVSQTSPADSQSKSNTETARESSLIP